jgi:hypothetical protein
VRAVLVDSTGNATGPITVTAATDLNASYSKLTGG